MIRFSTCAEQMLLVARHLPKLDKKIRNTLDLSGLLAKNHPSLTRSLNSWKRQGDFSSNKSVADALGEGNSNRFWKLVNSSGLRKSDVENLKEKAVETVAFRGLAGFEDARMYRNGISKSEELSSTLIRSRFGTEIIDMHYALGAADELESESSWRAALTGILDRVYLEKNFSTLAFNSIEMLSDSTDGRLGATLGNRLTIIPRADREREFLQTLTLIDKLDQIDGSTLPQVLRNAAKFAPEAAWTTFNNSLMSNDSVSEEERRQTGSKIISEIAEVSPSNAMLKVRELTNSPVALRRSLAVSAMEIWIETETEPALSWWANSITSPELRDNDALSEIIYKTATTEAHRHCALDLIVNPHMTLTGESAGRSWCLNKRCNLGFVGKG